MFATTPNNRTSETGGLRSHCGVHPFGVSGDEWRMSQVLVGGNKTFMQTSFSVRMP